MDFAISAMFLRQRADSKSKMDLAYNMAKAIKESFKENLNNLDWLDDETRLGVGEKVDAMDILTGKTTMAHVVQLICKTSYHMYCYTNQYV